jgi:hypothetical protein
MVTVFEYIFWTVFRWNVRRHSTGAEFGGTGIVVILIMMNIASILVAARPYSREVLAVVGASSRVSQVAFMVVATLVAHQLLGTESRRSQIERKIRALSASRRSRLRLASASYVVMTIALFAGTVFLVRSRIGSVS